MDPCLNVGASLSPAANLELEQYEHGGVESSSDALQCDFSSVALPPAIQRSCWFVESNTSSLVFEENRRHFPWVGQ
jgi:hypothetical protein